MDKVGRIDMSYGGRKFTSNNKQEGRARIKERLDRGVAAKGWIYLYPNALVSDYGGIEPLLDSGSNFPFSHS